jgi:hypothetical protein
LPAELPTIAFNSRYLGFSVASSEGEAFMKGKPWSVEEEKQLREMVQEHKRLTEIAEFFGKSPASIKMKINRLKLVVVVRQIQQTTTSNELPSVEEALKKLVAAMNALACQGVLLKNKPGSKVPV